MYAGHRLRRRPGRRARRRRRRRGARPPTSATIARASSTAGRSPAPADSASWSPAGRSGTSGKATCTSGSRRSDARRTSREDPAMIEFATASREFRSLIGRRRELQTLLGSVFAGLGIFLQNTLQGGLARRRSGAIKRHLFAVLRGPADGPLPDPGPPDGPAPRRPGAQRDPDRPADRRAGRSLRPLSVEDGGQAQLLRGLVPPVRPDGPHRRVLDDDPGPGARDAEAIYALLAGGVDHGRLDGPLLPVPPPGRPVRPQEDRGRALRRLRPRATGRPTSPGASRTRTSG